jgi:Putative peptidoglycan binding domain
MKSILYSTCIGTLALALTAGGAQAATDKNKRQERAKPPQRSATVQAARPANTGSSMAAHRNVSAAQNRQRSYTAPRTSSAVNRSARTAPARQTTVREQNVARNNRAVRPASRQTATARERNVAVNRTRNVDTRRPTSAPSATTRERNVTVNRTRNIDVNRERNVAVNRERNADVNRFRNANEFRNRNSVAINRNRNLTVNRTQNTAFYRGGNVRVTNNWRGEAFRGQRYAAFRNYNRQWHDRGWWRSHYTRIVFVNSGWWYWNAGYWFPAWGYAPSVSYAYDGPVYGYNGLSPDQVTVNVQEQLAAAGYYDGPIDGMLGPMTREAIAAYQADNGLAITSAIDEPTLATLGLV